MSVVVVFYFVISALIMVITHILIKKNYTTTELLCQLGATFFAILFVYGISSFMVGYDYKLIHGVVTDKEYVQKNCRMSWQEYKDSWCENHYSRSRSREVRKRDADGKYYTETEYYTEYIPKYRWERKWYVNTSIGDYRITSVDEQGVREPERYTVATKNDPVTSYEMYYDYVGAAAQSLFKYEDDDYKDENIRRSEVYDYYNINQVYVDGVILKDYRELNKKLAVVNSTLTTGANVIIMLTDKPQNYSTSLQVKWEGFEINDIVIVLGVDESLKKYHHVSVFSWSENSMVEVKIKDQLIFSDFTKIYDDIDRIGDIVNETYEEPSPDKFRY